MTFKKARLVKKTPTIYLCLLHLLYERKKICHRLYISYTPCDTWTPRVTSPKRNCKGRWRIDRKQNKTPQNLSFKMEAEKDSVE